MTYASMLLEKEHGHPDEKVRKDSGEMLAMLTPIAKAFMTDNGHISTNACMQVLAAMVSSKNGAWSSLCATTAST
jgi:hypothetical protein